MAKKSGAAGGIFGANTRTAATRVGDMTYVKHDQFIGRSLATYGEWAQIEIDRILAYISPGDFVIDVGANIGFHALSFARKVGKSGVVWAFEPDPVNGLLLRHNVMQAGLDEVVIPFDTAVSDTLAICRFRTVPISAPENFGHTGVDAVEGEYPRVCLPLDALLIDRAPALIKIDIEGHELPALGGMSELIEKHHPVLSIEADTPEEIEANGALAAALGYDVYSLVVNAYNPGNFAENATDIWKGHGRCANLLCVVPGKHRAPEGLDLVRRADSQRQAISHLGKSVGAAYSGVSVDEAQLPVQHGLSSTRADIRRFVSDFLKSTYGKLDPVTDAALVDGALDFLAATGPSTEGLALQRLIIAGVESFAEALGGRVQVQELAQAKAERELLRDEVLELRATIDGLGRERSDLENQHRLVLEDASSRLAASDAALVRLEAELARQAETARRELGEALAQTAEAEKRAEDARIDFARHAEDAEAATATLSANIKTLDGQLAAATERRVQLEAELKAVQQQSDQETSELAKKLEVANEVAGQQAREIAQLLEDKREFAIAIAATESEHGKLLSELSEARERLALQAQQLRHLRAANG